MTIGVYTRRAGEGAHPHRLSSTTPDAKGDPGSRLDGYFWIPGSRCARPGNVVSALLFVPGSPEVAR